MSSLSQHVHRACRRALAGALLAILPSSPSAAGDVVVDVELVLAVDVSLSMSPGELAIQRDGYAAALTHPAVIAAIGDGAHGRIAVTYVEWAGTNTQHVVVPWTEIATADHARAFVAAMTVAPPRSARRTSVSAALTFAARLFDDSGFRGMKRVIDVSGDGPNNQGDPIVIARDAVTAKGITINGLPLMTGGGFASAYDIGDLDRYYADCVIGGPGAFVIPVNEWSQFPEAVRRKLILELADKGSRHQRAAERGFPVLRVAERPASDCMIGEKIWNNRSWIDLQ